MDYGVVKQTYVSLAERIQEQMGIPYVLLDGAFDRIAATIERSASYGRTDHAEGLAHYTERTLEETTCRDGAIAQEKRPRVYYGRGPNGLDTGLEGSINVESLERVGATNAAAELGRGGLVQVSFEQVLRWDPDVIVTIDANFEATMRRDPLWRDSDAVEAGRMYLAPRVPYGWIDSPPSVNRLIGLRWLANVLYPAVFTEDLRPLVREFYIRFYHQAPTEQQIDKLLATVQPRRDR